MEFSRKPAKPKNGQIDPDCKAGFSTAQRQAAMDFGRASVALEGLKVSPEAEALQRQWVRGEISLEACVDAIKRRYQSTVLRDASGK
jgi:antitoxin VbhA-like protein